MRKMNFKLNVLLMGLFFALLFANNSYAKSQAIYLPAGAILQVGDDLNAAVFGYDECPENGGTDCVMLTGKSQVDVRLIQSDGTPVKEVWIIEREEDRFQMVRPNGWIVKRPVKDPTSA